MEKAYHEWLNSKMLTEEERGQLEHMSKEEQEASFHAPLAFGTGGIRGELGIGIAKLNRFTVCKATMGLAQYIVSKGEEAKAQGVVISYDSRRMSYEFAIYAARVLGTHGIKAYVFKELRPTPELSFAVRYLGCSAGIMITASHNPPEYNGYKVYGEDGAQLNLENSAKLIAYVDDVTTYLDVNLEEIEVLEAKQLLSFVLEEIDEAYQEAIRPSLFESGSDDIRVVFTPLHGTATKPVMDALQTAGYNHVVLVEEQAMPDGEFPTVQLPNPEDPAVFDLAKTYGERTNADILIATDPDCDRLGVAVRHEGEYILLTGNETGAIFTEYLLTRRKENGMQTSNDVVINTIVTSDLVKKICEAHDVSLLQTLTGFKFIGEKIRMFETTNEYNYVFGYEESYGSLVLPVVRDKDAVQASIVAVEIAAYYKKQGKTLIDVYRMLEETHGYFVDTQTALTMKGLDGMEKIARVMEYFRNEGCRATPSVSDAHMIDYANDETGLPKENVLKYILPEKGWIALRPSGTEPKLKIYYSIIGATKEEGTAFVTLLDTEIRDCIDRL